MRQARWGAVTRAVVNIVPNNGLDKGPDAADDTVRAATTDEIKDLRAEVRDLKEVVVEQTLEKRLFKKA